MLGMRGALPTRAYTSWCDSQVLWQRFLYELWGWNFAVQDLLSDSEDLLSIFHLVKLTW